MNVNVKISVFKFEVQSCASRYRNHHTGTPNKNQTCSLAPIRDWSRPRGAQLSLTPAVMDASQTGMNKYDA